MIGELHWILKSIRWDAYLDGALITVNVEDGNVDNLQAKRSAGRYARGIVGVWRVKNRIKIRGEAPSDSKIETYIDTSIAENPYLEPFEIDVSVNGGVVYLYGAVDTVFEKSQAGELAANQIGVKSVKNYIDIRTPTGAIYSPYAGIYYNYSEERPGLDATVTFDWEIKEDIEFELFWSPFISSEDVKVKVEDGVATLTGSVDTWTEYNAAEDNAYEGGAVDVVNKLVFEFGPVKKYGPY